MDKNFRIRLGISFLCIAILGIGVMIRAAHLMLMPSERLETAMNRQFRQDPPRMPRRGYILDRNREPIAVSMEVKSLFANPGKVTKPIEIANLLSKALGIPAQQIRAKLKSEKGFVWIKRQLNDQEREAIEDLLDQKPALSVFLGLSKESKRFYPHQGLASHFVGFTGLDSNGLEGLELFYEKELKGRSQNKKPIDGYSLILTIDKTLQYTLEQELAAGLKDTGGLSATAMIMDANNGDILAMASAPNFNPNKFGSYTADQRRNRSVTDTYEPGSTMKPILVAAALEEGIVSSKTPIFCEYGKYKIGKHWIRESEAKDKWGWLKVGQVLQKSSNIGATKIGNMVGPEKIYSWYKKLGIAEKTGIDLPGEASGSLAKPEGWSKILQSNISFGHGLTVTPLQIIRAYSAIANGGKLVTPRLVKQWNSFEGETIKEFSPQTPKQMLQPKTVKTLTEMISAVATEEGTAPKANIPGFVIAGKTGTSQKPIPGKGYRSGKHMASFVGFVRDIPLNYVVYVLVDEPKFPYYGGEAAAPIFRRIMAAALAQEGISPNPNLIPMEKIGKSEEPKKVKDSVRSVAAAVAPITELTKADDYWLMPQLDGMTAREVLDLFSEKELRLQLKGSGLVKSQKPSSGALLKKGDLISVRLEKQKAFP
jgi:cell division protein FtsI (penicillin-binding protein 3)